MIRRNYWLSCRRLLFLSCCCIFVSGLITFNTAYRYTQASQIEAARPFTLTMLESQVDIRGVLRRRAILVQEVDSNGNWTSIKSYIGKQGWVRIDQSEGLQLITTSSGESAQHNWPSSGERLQQTFRDENFLRNHKYLDRTETYLGLNVFVIKYTMNNGEWLEQTYSPKTGPVALRLVNHYPDGSEFRREGIQIEFR